MNSSKKLVENSVIFNEKIRQNVQRIRVFTIAKKRLTTHEFFRDFGLKSNWPRVRRSCHSSFFAKVFLKLKTRLGASTKPVIRDWIPRGNSTHNSGMRNSRKTKNR